MRAVIKGKTCIIQDGRGQVIVSVVKKGAGGYRIVPPKGKGLEFEGCVVGSTGWMSYSPGDNMGISTLDGVAVEVRDPENFSYTSVTAK